MTQKKPTIWERIKDFNVLCEKQKPRKVILSVYSLLWMGSILVQAASYLAVFAFMGEKPHWTSVIAVPLFALSTLIVFFYVYHDLEHLDEEPAEIEKLYVNWINTKIEWIFRLLIIVALFVGTGKISFLSYESELGPRLVDSTVSLLKNDETFSDNLSKIETPSEKSKEAFAWAASMNIVICSLLIAWNIGAILRRSRIQKSDELPVATDKASNVVRLWLFTVMLALAWVYWIVLTTQLDSINNWSTLLVALYVFVFLFFWLFRRKSNFAQKQSTRIAKIVIDEQTGIPQ